MQRFRQPLQGQCILTSNSILLLTSFSDKKGFREKFWRASTHRTFAYGDTADTKVTEIYARKEFFRLKSQYTTMNDAKNYDASSMGDLTAEIMDDFEEIANEGWACEYGIAEVGKDAVALPVQQQQQPQQQQPPQQDEDKEMTDPNADKEEKSMVHDSPPGPFTLAANGATDGKAVVAGGDGPLPRQPGFDINAWLAQSNGGSGPFPSKASTTGTAPTDQIKVATASEDDEPGSPALPRRSIIFKGTSNVLVDPLLSEAGNGNWLAMLKYPGMNQKWPFCESYNMMCEADRQGGSMRNRMRWMKRRVEEWVEIGGDGCRC